MGAHKMTFTFDSGSVSRLRRTAERLGKSQSEVVREAIRDYSERVGRLSEHERLRLLAVFDEVVPKIPSRPVRAVEAEIRAVRAARRKGGRGRP